MAQNYAEGQPSQIIKDLKAALKDFEPMVKNPRSLWNGREMKSFCLRPREAWANWLICAVLKEIRGDDITFAEDKQGDGLIINKTSGQVVQTEHVSALEIPNAAKSPLGERRILDAIAIKTAKGEEYARGKTLVVFFDGAGEFYRNKIRESIFGAHHFDAVICVGLLLADTNGYVYAVTEFRDKYEDHSVTYKVSINHNFTEWDVVELK